VEQRIDQMVTDGKITAEQAVQLKAAALKSYEELQKKLKELSVAEVQVEVPKTE
jgi:polyhydroxyalkanoate synthesis regulator phasin